MTEYENNTQICFRYFERLQSETSGPFSVLGPMPPFLLLLVLKTALDRKIGAAKHLDEFLSISNGLNRPTPELRLKDVEPILDSVCNAAGDSGKTIKQFFWTTMQAFDSLASKGSKNMQPVEMRTVLDDSDHVGCYFREAIRLSTRYTRFFSRTVSNPSIASLAKHLLIVDEGESFCDFTCGPGLSSSIILEDRKNVTVALSDIVPEAFACATIGCFLQGLTNKGSVDDSLSEGNLTAGLHADKLFIDPPLRAKMNNPFMFGDIQIRESSCAAVMKSVSVLNDGGTAFVCINNGFTFGTQFSMQMIRKYIIEYGYLKAVVSLPAMWPEANALTTVLVLSKDKNESVVMIDLSGSSNDCSLFVYDRLNQALMITEEGQNLVNSIIKEKTVISGRSAIIRAEEIVENEYSFLPGIYIKKEVKNRKSVADIDVEIRDTIKEIQKLMDELAK